jgi:hypothetical protein
MRKMLRLRSFPAILERDNFRRIWGTMVRAACKGEAMEGNTASKRLYVELMAHLIDREMAKFRRGTGSCRPWPKPGRAR